jgi:predicted CopG family antitoxin
LFERDIYQLGGIKMKKRIIVPFIFAMSLGVTSVHADEVKPTNPVKVTQKVKVQKPQQLKDLQAQIKTLRAQKAQLNTQIHAAFKQKVDALKQQAKLIASSKDKSKVEKKAALAEVKAQLATIKGEHKAYSEAVKKLWEDRKSKWETVKGTLKNKEYDVAIKELQAIEANLKDAIALKTQYLTKISN